MARILLLMEHEENRRLLAELLAPAHTVLESRDRRDLAGDHDLIVVGGAAAHRLMHGLTLMKRERAPIFLPVLLVSTRAEYGDAESELWQAVDDMLPLPVRKAELQARIELLLRTRRLSQQVQRHSDDLQALVHGLTHDLRAPARAAVGFAQLLRCECGEAMGETGQHYLQRIEDAASRMQEVLEFLITFAALGRSQVTCYALPLADAVAQILERFEDEIASRGATVTVEGPTLSVLGDPVLLDMVISNLVSNALKYVTPGSAPHVDIRMAPKGALVRLTVQDQGIGIPEADQAHVWQPFVRLHGQESYPGTGLGLAIARKAAELMEGELALSSEPGRGSCFSLVLRLAEEA